MPRRDDGTLSPDRQWRTMPEPDYHMRRLPMPTPTDRDLAVTLVDDIHGHTMEFSSDPDRHRGDYRLAEKALAQARREGLQSGREEGIREALGAVEYGIADEEAKDRGFRSWDAENCVSAVRALLDQPPRGKSDD